MLIDYEYRRMGGVGKLILSYLNDNGRIQMKTHTWNNPAAFEICHPGDPSKIDGLRTWDNKPVKIVNCETPKRYSIYEFIDRLPPDEQEELFKYVEPEIYFMDIETEIVDGFPSQYDAKTRVLSIATVLKEEVLLMGLKDISDEELAQMEEDMKDYFKPYKKNYKIKYLHYESEYDMMYDLFHTYIPKMAVLTGWNFINYDWVYLVNRAERLGIDPTIVSFTKRLEATRKRPHERMPKHRMIVDYMDLYSKWDTSVKVKESNKLDFVASKVVGLPKLTYTGTLKSLYEKDYYRFMLYNIIDTILVQLIHEKRRYIDVMLGISSLARVRMNDAYSTIAVTEGVLRKPFREKMGIVLVNDYNTEDLESIKGGWVKDPAVGMHKWVACYDFASLYPTTMRQFNIAPESYKGIKINDQYSSFNNQKLLIEDSDIILSIKDDDNNVVKETVFKNEDSVTKQMLTDVYNDRKKHKKQMMIEKDKHKELENFYKEMANALTEEGIDVEAELDKIR
jgi:DNA polymerase elongation subunit (family B)